MKDLASSGGEHISVIQWDTEEMEPVKKARKGARRKYVELRGENYVFRLFVAGTESNSSQAGRNLTRLCEEQQRSGDLSLNDMITDRVTD